jgi:hypothetical protein
MAINPNVPLDPDSATAVASAVQILRRYAFGSYAGKQTPNNLIDSYLTFLDFREKTLNTIKDTLTKLQTPKQT